MLLLQSPGEIVTRADIQKRLWREGAFVDIANGINSAVRKLQDVIGDNPEDPRFIETLPGRGYRFIHPVLTGRGLLEKTLAVRERALAETPVARQVNPVSKRSWVRRVLAAALVALFLPLFVLLRPGAQPSQFEATPITSEVGVQLCPSFAPDGQRVTYSWNGEKQDNFDIYVKQIGEEARLRLTSDPKPDLSPVWSPDGRTIAFVRITSFDRAEVRQISAFAGGQERILADIGAPQELYRNVRLLSWSPDGKWIAVSDATARARAAIYLVPVESGSKRQITQPGAAWGDYDPAFSPDGTRLAFARQYGPEIGELYILNLTRELEPQGEPRQITFDNRRISSPVWTLDGRTLLCVRLVLPTQSSICKIRLSSPRHMEPLPVPADNVVALALAQRRARLLYARQTDHVNLWALDIPRNKVAEHTRASPRLWLPSSRRDVMPSFSPDGQQVVFQSLRSGWSEIWRADRDGSHLRPLTDLRGTVAGSPRWSPDGATIVFHSRKPNIARLFILDVAAARTRPLAYEVINDTTPSWSHDGQSIYFQSSRTGEAEIWKVPAKGGQRVQLTRHGGLVALESADGGSLVYTKPFSPGLWRMALSDGNERQLFSAEIAGHKSAFGPGRSGIYFIRQDTLQQKEFLEFFPFEGGPATKVADLARRTELGFALSPDERTILYSQVDHISSELMIVEQFR